MSVEHPLPFEGVDLRAELAAHQRSRVEQALARTKGNLAEAARLLRMTPLELARLQAAARALPPIPRPVTSTTASRRPGRPLQAVRRVSVATVEAVAGASRIDRGVEVISGPAIRRFAADGLNERQIAKRLGCNPFVVEKVLRMQAEKGELRKCGALPAEQEP
jgi:hypothetical protein